MFVGQTRFSIFNPGSGAWKSSSKTDSNAEDDFAEYLYSDSRLAPRAEIFFNHSLPMLAGAAERHRLLHIVSYSSNLPEKYRNQLESAALAHPFILLDEKEPGEQASSWMELVPPDLEVGDIVGAYRLDDDDLLANDFFDRMSQYLDPAFAGMWVSFANGYTAVLSDGVVVNPRQLTWPKIAIGLTGIYRKDRGQTFSGPSLRGGHNRVDQNSPVILDSREPSFLWLRSTGQDSLVNVPESEREQTVLDQIKSYDFADDSQFKALFPQIDQVRFPRVLEFNEGCTVTGKPEQFDFDTPAQKFVVSYSYRCDNVLDHRHYLLKFDLRRRNGFLVDRSRNTGDVPKVEGDSQSSNPGWGFFKFLRLRRRRGTGQTAVDLPQGISHSPNPDVGFFKYLPLRRGRGTGRVAVDLPPGLECHGIEIREWKKPHTPLRIASLQVEVEQ